MSVFFSQPREIPYRPMSLRPDLMQSLTMLSLWTILFKKIVRNWLIAFQNIFPNISHSSSVSFTPVNSALPLPYSLLSTSVSLGTLTILSISCSLALYLPIPLSVFLCLSILHSLCVFYSLIFLYLPPPSFSLSA